MYISIQYIYSFLMQWKCKRLTTIIFGMVCSNRTLVVMLHKQILLISDCLHLMLPQLLTIPLILSALSQILHMLVCGSPTLQHVSAICSLFSSQLNTSNFSSVLMSFTDAIALGGGETYFSLMLLIKVNAVQEETKWAMWLYHQLINPYTGLTV